MPTISKQAILYEDNHLLVLNKPAGLATMGVAAGSDSLWQRACEYIKQKYAKPGNVFLGVVSRLDSAVSGVIVFARTSKAAARLSEQFREGRAKKIYWAIVSGRTAPPDAAHLEHWLEKNEIKRQTVVSKVEKAGWKKASLDFKTLATLDSGLWLLEINLLSGRKHQIRAQLSACGWPVLGDRKYGSPLAFESGIALHSYSLSIVHPTQNREVSFSVSPPKTWKLAKDGLH